MKPVSFLLALWLLPLYDGGQLSERTSAARGQRHWLTLRREGFELASHRTDQGWVRQEQNAKPNVIRAGMTAVEVRRLRGEPDRIARQHLNRRYLEQWIYERPPSLRVEFHGAKGQEARVVQVHPLLH